MDLRDVLSDKPIPARTESATDVKPEASTEVAATTGDVEATEPAATSAAKDEKPAPAEKPAEADSTRERDDKGRFVKTVPHEALHAEKQRRRELEAELAKAREAKPPPSVLEDEDGAFKARLNEHAEKVVQPLMAKLFKLSVKAARHGRDDYDEVAEAFIEAANKDPQLDKAWRESDDPGEYAYAVGKQIKELADVGGDIVKYGEKKQAEVKVKLTEAEKRIKALEAEVATLKDSKDKQAKVPQSLNGEQSAAHVSGDFAGPTPLKSILS